ncbi:hypothetical protein Q31b_55000 [Novipirellula aureliae]|uniref:Probable inorganic carbon transporter subunit DabA n=1 Tax=Novipirellula aureliae TaxID=2527966 RepID=A0A5C6DHM4_9BACT|nr:DUF2309 domain-containing protein [Novipirellula aureliae]TWU34546.1 hypothetical protein Q31b_55000 [Novipirellula aureliae]
MIVETSEQPSESNPSDSRLDELQSIIDHAIHFLPAQGPIEVFVHHNTLHAFEDKSFHEAARLASKIYDANPYLSEQRYREMLESKRIRIADLKAVLADDMVSRADATIDGLGTRFDLRLSMLLYPLRTAPEAELRWVIAESDALSRFRPEVSSLVREQVLEATQKYVLSSLVRIPTANGSSTRQLADLLDEFGHGDPAHWSERRWEEFTLRYLWQVCDSGIRAASMDEGTLRVPIRGRDALLAATGQDTDRYVHETLIRFCAAFLDQGYADWRLPQREAGLFGSFVEVYGKPSLFAESWLHSLPDELKKISQAQMTPLESIDESLTMLGVPMSDRAMFITKSLLALGGWAGMIWQLESSATWVDRPIRPGSLMEFLAVRLILDRVAIDYVAREYLRFGGALSQVSDAAWKKAAALNDSHFQTTFQIFQVAQSMGWAPQAMGQMSTEDWRALIGEVRDFDELHRRCIFHEAYEKSYRTDALDALTLHCRTINNGPKEPISRPSFQIVCCLDDREESIRRHIEEVDPAAITYGAAGFFAVVMNYQGAADAGYKPLCPVVVTPKHFVRENVGYTFAGEDRRRAGTRRTLGHLTHQVHSRSRTIGGGALTAIFGSLAAFPLVARVLFPRITSQIRRRAGRFVQPPPITQLQLERYQVEPGPENGHVGYTVDEMVEIVSRLLNDIGALKNFSRLFVVTGHGSSSTNNPHESAYNCGACAGKRGGPNARAVAQMANDWRVRAKLLELGLRIPNDTVFLGAYHNTCDDSLVWFDLDRMPSSHFADFEHVKTVVDEARKRNAHERCRRFELASLDLTPTEALRHVEQRSEDLSQVRPEYNHATDAMCFVGRRDWSRGLFLDRRTFLTSYDPAVDDEEQSILLGILSAAIPVCAGISLEYYFSAVDNGKFGSGSKLPHNIASLLGVMEGATSDLRTGLYQQMVEIHEPMRILFVIETTPDAMRSVMQRHVGIRRLVEGEWVQLALIDAETSTLLFYRNGDFHPHRCESSSLPQVNQSSDWYSGCREHLGFATIRKTAIVDRPLIAEAAKEFTTEQEVAS